MQAYAQHIASCSFSKKCDRPTLDLQALQLADKVHWACNDHQAEQLSGAAICGVGESLAADGALVASFCRVQNVNQFLRKRKIYTFTTSDKFRVTYEQLKVSKSDFVHLQAMQVIVPVPDDVTITCLLVQ